MRQIILLAVLFFVGSNIVFAQSETFNVRIFGGNDITPPTTPTLLSANPVSSTQIDLSWSSSTDNFSVSGYVLTRGSSTIATTSLLNYSDTGLIASTSYSYTVRAFDSSLNYSSTSNSISATTPNTPAPPVVSGDSSEGTASRVVLKNFLIDSGESTSNLTIETARPSRLEIRWGRTDSYEIGYIVGSVLKKDHNFYITELEPNTTYVYEVVGYTPYGKETVLKKGFFTTKSDAPAALLTNVSRFQANSNGTDVELSWQNPKDESFSNVRIVRSHLGYPTHPADGAIVYHGLKSNFVDKYILSVYSPVYYTAFVYDDFGNVSSGAIALAYLLDDEGTVESEYVPKSVSEATSSIDYERVTAEMKMPQSNDIFIIQSGIKFSMLDDPVRLFSENEFVVTVPVGSIAGNLKSIILTIVDPTDNRKDYSYLLRINHDRSAYVATIPPLNVLGESQIKVEIFDYEAFVVGVYKTRVIFVETPVRAEINISENYSSFKWDIIYIFLFGIFALCLIILMILLLYKRKHEDKNQEES